MNVFLAGIIQGSLVEAAIHKQDWREPIKDILRRRLPGADVYCHYSLHPNSITYDLAEIRRVLAEGNARAAACDLLIAYVPSASMGTAIEMHEASRSGAVVVAVSPLSANWVVRAYSDRVVADFAALDELLGSEDFSQLLRSKGKA
jgi:hypothetical protein